MTYLLFSTRVWPVQKDPVVAGKLKAAAGLAFLQSKKYKQAARRFTEVLTG